MASQQQDSYARSQMRQPLQEKLARPPSPPLDGSRCSLPSISNLIHVADSSVPGHSSGRPHSSESTTNSWHHQEAQRRGEAYHLSSAQPTSHAAHRSHDGPMPPTPPMDVDYSFEQHSPQLTSYPSASGFNRERASESYSTPSSSATQSTFQQTLAAAPQPENRARYRDPESWQYWNYMHPGSTMGYALPVDRYICVTCNKAFSRPSSLRIHSHSHTGEKPFKCQHAGCGKAFSVRSNMKRHERGCHSYEISPPYYGRHYPHYHAGYTM